VSCNVGPSLALSLLIAALSWACGAPSQPKDPQQVLSAYSSALASGNAQEAYALLSSEAQRTLSFGTFQHMLAENPREVANLARGLAGPAGPPHVTATVSTPHGETLELVLEDGVWKVEGSALDLYSQANPRAAVVSFVRAYENNRYDLLLKFVPDSKLAGLTAKKLQESFEGKQREALDRLSQALKNEAPKAKIELLGDHATLRYGGGGTIELLEEHGVWKIEEFYP